MAFGILEVMLVNAKGLGDSDFFGGMDPYVLVQYKSQEHKSSVAQEVQGCSTTSTSALQALVTVLEKAWATVSVTVRGGSEGEGAVEGKHLVWNEKIAVKVEYPGADEHYKLILKIMDKDTFSADDFIGQVTIYIRDLLAQGLENGTAELPPQKHSIVTADQSYRGEVEVGLAFTPKVEEETGMEEEVGGWRQSDY